MSAWGYDGVVESLHRNIQTKSGTPRHMWGGVPVQPNQIHYLPVWAYKSSEMLKSNCDAGKAKYPDLEVPKADFDALLGKMLRTDPPPKTAIPKKARRQRSDLP